MSLVTILLIILIILAFGGGGFLGGGAYRGPGFGLGGILLIVLIVLLVTGRILDELRRVAGDLHFVDGVVAENGAVVHFPDNGRTTMLAPAMPESFVREVRRRGIPFRARR